MLFLLPLQTSEIFAFGKFKTRIASAAQVNSAIKFPCLSNCITGFLFASCAKTTFLLAAAFCFSLMAYPISDRISTLIVAKMPYTNENRLSSCHYSSSISLKYGLPQYGQRTSLNRSEKQSGIGFLPSIISGYSNSALQSSHLYTPMRLLAGGVPFVTCRWLRRMEIRMVAAGCTNDNVLDRNAVSHLSLSAVHSASRAMC